MSMAQINKVIQIASQLLHKLANLLYITKTKLFSTY